MPARQFFKQQTCIYFLKEKEELNINGKGFANFVVWGVVRGWKEAKASEMPILPYAVTSASEYETDSEVRNDVLVCVFVSSCAKRVCFEVCCLHTLLFYMEDCFHTRLCSPILILCREHLWLSTYVSLLQWEDPSFSNDENNERKPLLKRSNSGNKRILRYGGDAMNV